MADSYNSSLQYLTGARDLQGADSGGTSYTSPLLPIRAHTPVPRRQLVGLAVPCEPNVRNGDGAQGTASPTSQRSGLNPPLLRRKTEHFRFHQSLEVAKRHLH